MVTQIERIQFRQDTPSNWTTDNPVLAVGEPGFETGTWKLKIGDGVTSWTALDYFAGSDDSGGGGGSSGSGNVFNSAALGNGTLTVIPVAHGLGNATPEVVVYNIAGSFPVRVRCGVWAPDNNTVNLVFSTAPETASIKCTVMG